MPLKMHINQTKETGVFAAHYAPYLPFTITTSNERKELCGESITRLRLVSMNYIIYIFDWSKVANNVVMQMHSA
jgi:hypothetical protein